MPVPVMRIGKMQVEVGQGKMGVPVGVGLAIRTQLVVEMLMVGAVGMGMLMIH